MADNKHRRVIEVEITAEDIERGVRNHSGQCMVAQAVRRAYPKADRVMVDIQTIRFTDTATGRRLLWLTPAIAQDHIVAFDGGEYSRLHPFGLNLRRRDARTLQRKVPTTPEDHERRKAADVAGKSTAGVRHVADPPMGEGVSRSARRSPATTSRSYGRRAIHVNQARVRTGDLPPEPEPIPGVDR